MKQLKMHLQQFHKMFQRLYHYIIIQLLMIILIEKKFSLLRGVIKGISRQPGRQEKPTNPIRNFLLVEIVKKYNKFTFLNVLWKVMFTFAKSFALRTGEYTPPTQTPDNRTLLWQHLNFSVL